LERGVGRRIRNQIDLGKIPTKTKGGSARKRGNGKENGKKYKGKKVMWGEK